MANGKQQNTPPGPGVDASGQSVVDPTENVKAGLEAAKQRLDDLRDTEAVWSRRLNKCEANNMREIVRLNNAHLNEKMELRGEHTKEMRKAESERIDAIRAVDQATIATGATAAAATATALAKTVVDSAEALRNSVDAKFGLMQTAISDLQRFQFESAGGKQQVVESRSAASDLQPVLDRIEQVFLAQSRQGGGQDQVVERRASSNQMWIAVGALAAVMFGIASLLVAVLK